MTSSDDLTLPPGSRILHVGPHKTGTTTLQSAFHVARNRLAAKGVAYAGRERQPMLAARAISGQNTREGAIPLSHWDRLCSEVARVDADKRVVISSEYFSGARDRHVPAIIEGLGGAERIHVVVTVRPLVKIMPSQWQQYIQDGTQAGWGEWLKGMLLEPPYQKPSPSFWLRHQHDDLVRRYAEVVGPENVTVIVVDSADPSRHLRTFESMLALDEGDLVPEDAMLQRSLTYPEVEIVRAVNMEFKQREWPDVLYGRVIRQGVSRYLRDIRTPPKDEPRVAMPTWAVDEACRIGGRIAEGIDKQGVRVIGDLGILDKRPSHTIDEIPETAPVTPEMASRAIFGALVHCGYAPQSDIDDARKLFSGGPDRTIVSLLAPESGGLPATRRLAVDKPDIRLSHQPLNKIRTTTLVRVLGQRVARKIRRTVGR